MNSYTLLLYAAAGLGAAIGGMARFWASAAVARLLGEGFPWGTLVVNVSGSAALGFFAALTAPEGRLLIPPAGRVFVMVGLCGGFTTFSTFSLETLNLTRNGEFWRAGWNVAANIVTCLVAVWGGYWAAMVLSRR